jgi:PAS domain S-box-containing protein
MFNRPEIDIHMAETIFDKSKIGLSFVSKDGMFLRCNQTLCELLGYSEAELKRKNFADLTHPEDISGDLEMLRKVLNNEIDEYPITKRYITKSGAVIWVKLVVTGIKNIDNAVVILFSQILPIDPSNPQDISSIIDIKLKEFGVLLTEKLEPDDDDINNKIEKGALTFIKNEWKWIIAFSITIISGIIAWETNRRMTDYKNEQIYTQNEQRFTKIESNIEDMRKINEKSFNEIKTLLKDTLKDTLKD